MDRIYGNGTTLIPSPLKRGDFVQHEGQLHQIISYCAFTRIRYTARKIEDNQVVFISLPVTAPPTTREEEDYFQITELSENKEATLKPWSGGTPERRMKVWWEEDVELIKDGLMMEDKEVFCTVMKVMGKEVMGDIKYMDKDPPIMKMPDLVMDIIFSKLTPEDQLNSRLVCRRWALDLIPIKKFVTCNSLTLHHEGAFADNNVSVGFLPRLGPNSVDEDEEDPSNSISMKDLHPLIRTSLLDNVEKLCLEWKSGRSDNELQAIFEQCQKINDFEFSRKGGHDGETDPDDKDWVLSKKLINANARKLKSLGIRAYLRELDLKKDVEVEKCTTLQDLDIELNREHSVLLNLQCIPSSITNLSILRVAVPFTRSQVLWIAVHLSNLEHLDLDVHHVHADADTGDENMDEDEIDESTVLDLVTMLMFLKRATFYLGPFIIGGNGSCRKGKQLRDNINNELDWKWVSRIMFRPTNGDEALLVKMKKEFEDLAL